MSKIILEVENSAVEKVMWFSCSHSPEREWHCDCMHSQAEIVIVDGKIIDVIIKDVKGKKPLGNSELKEFQTFVQAFQNEIVQKWINYFVLHQSIHCIKIEGKVK